jgi:thiamine-monophosphate kinase
VHADKIPVSENLKIFCRQFNFDPVEYALSGGEDYTLLCTVSPDKAGAIAKKFQTEFCRPPFRVGAITAGRAMKLNYPDGSSTPIAPTGWNHFSDE